MEKSEKVTWLATIVLVGFAVGILFHYVLGSYLHAGIPLNSFLSNDVSDSVRFYFYDFSTPIYLVKNLSPYLGTPQEFVNYFPMGYLLFYPFSLIKNFYLSYILYLLVFLIPFVCLNHRFLSCNNLGKIDNFKNIFILSFISYPILCLIISGNLDMILYFFVLGFVYSFYKEKYLLAALLLAVANAAKPFFLIFLFLFLFKKKWKEFFWSLILTVIFILGGFFIFKGSLFSQIHLLSESLIIFKVRFIDGSNALILGSSDMFLALKYMLCTITKIISGPDLLKWFSILYPIVISIVLFFSYREKTFWKQIALITLCILTFSPVVLDYKLIYLYIPLLLFMDSKEKSKFDLVYIILYGLMLIPKKVLMIGLNAGIFLSKITNPFIMLSFIVLIIFEQIYNHKKSE